MSNYETLYGKTISAIDQTKGDKGTAIIILKFEEGESFNIIAVPNSDKGVANIDLNYNGMQENTLIGKRVHQIGEEFNNAISYVHIIFKDGNKLSISGYSSTEEGTVTIETTVHGSQKLVAESLEENTNMNPMRQRYKMNYEDGPDPDRQAAEIMVNLEDHLEEHKIYDEDEELDEIESWLMTNVEDESNGIKIAVMKLVLQKYDVSPHTLGILSWGRGKRR